MNTTAQLIKTLSNSAFPETTIPYKIFVCEDRNLLAVCCSVYTQWSGRNVSVGVRTILLYNANSLVLIANLDDLDHEVNDISFHPTEDVLVIGIGSYDGGAIFSGQLLLWNYRSGQLQSVLKESRDVTHCSFENNGTSILFSLNPETDFDDVIQTEYNIAYPVKEQLSLENLPIRQTYEEDDYFPYDRESRVTSSVSKLSALAENKMHIISSLIISGIWYSSMQIHW